MNTTAPGHDPRHHAVHGARAARRQGSRRAHRHLRLRRRPLRNGDRQEGVRGQEPAAFDRGDRVRRNPIRFRRRSRRRRRRSTFSSKRCLAKDPEQRLQTATDLVWELQWIAGGGTEGGVAAPAARRGRRARIAQLALVAASLLAAVMAVLAFMSPRRHRGAGGDALPHQRAGHAGARGRVDLARWPMDRLFGSRCGIDGGVRPPDRVGSASEARRARKARAGCSGRRTAAGLRSSPVAR